MRAKTAQATRMLIYVMTIVIVGLVLVFGYRAIAAITNTGEKASLLTFKNDFTNAVAQGSSYGRIGVQDFVVGGGYKQLCLASLDAPELAFSHQLVRDAIRSGTADNAFLTTDSIIEPFTVNRVDVEGGGQCFPVQNGRVRLRFEGKGDRTKVMFAAE